MLCESHLNNPEIYVVYTSMYIWFYIIYLIISQYIFTGRAV